MQRQLVSMPMRHVLTLLVFLLGHASARAELPESLQRALHGTSVPPSAIGLVVQPLDQAQPDIAHNADEAFNPASVMKLLTTLAALDTLGPAHTWTTTALIEGEVIDGTLHGNLILRGGGDPSMNVERFWALLHDIKARGLHTIRGDVILDNSLYAIDPVDPGDFDQAPLKPYNANPAALMVNYNAVALYLQPTGPTLAGRLEPPGLPLDVRVRVDANKPCNGWQEGLDIHRENERVSVDGTYPQACGTRSQWINLMCPAATVATYFKAFWSEAGGVLTGQMRLGEAGPYARVWAERESEPLALSIRDVNKFSNNVMAKMLFLNLGASRYGAPATWEKGQASIVSWLADKGLALPELVIENGSGLSRIERISPRSVSRLLDWAARQPLYYEFAASLPALGQEGTQKRRLTGTAYAGRGWLKSGTLNGVRNLAGYLIDAAGRRKLLVLFIRHPNTAQASLAQDAVLEWVLAGR
jgi:D-alanyl-D-alanine carboxypeptidase/D-alanyl-D-alanine-endopeptidase (penicillin-binding protein 4)